MDDNAENPVQNSGVTSVPNQNAVRSACAQLVATLIQSWLLVCIGLEMALPSELLAELHNQPKETLNMNDSQASWFGSLPSLTHTIGSVLSGYLQERFGRKGSMLLVTIPILIAWLTLYFAQSIEALYAGSILMGVCCGLSEAPLHSYIGEIAEPRNRGTLSTLSTSAVSVGMLLMYIIGYFFAWRTMLLICAGIAFVTFVFITQIPESPTWLIANNRLKEAQKSLGWLRGWVKPENVQDEFFVLVEYTKNSINKGAVEPLLQKPQEAVESNSKAESDASENDCFLKTRFKEIADKKVLRPLRMVLIVFVISFVTCLLFLKPYLVGILTELRSPLNGKLVLIMYGTAFLVGMILNMACLWRFGKRKIALFSQVVGTLSVLLLGLYCTFLLGSDLFPGIAWSPVILILTIRFCNGFGMGPLPWQLISEVFPPKGRGTAGGISAAWAHIVMAIMIKSFLFFKQSITLTGVIFFYGTIAVLGTIYLYIYLPETEGKTLEQIESYFTKNYDRKEKFSFKPVGKSRSKLKGSLNDLNQRAEYVKCPKEEA